MFNQKVIILSVDQWSLTKEDGSNLSGCTMFYYPADNLNKIINNAGSAGMKPCKESMPFDFINRINEKGGCPCMAELRTVMRSRNGKQFLAIEGLDFIEGNVEDYLFKNNK